MPIIKRYVNQQQVAESFASWFYDWVESHPSNQSKITVALSGGSTPKLLFKLWAAEYRDKLPWNRVHFFWGDERCVDPDDPESNYGQANRLFLDHISINRENVHRIRGESDPVQEAERYANDIRAHVELNKDAWPKFDLIMLGMGSDGHTASIFPNQMEILDSNKICVVASHPSTGQKRITITGRVLNAASCVTFLVVGKEKWAVLSDILDRREGFKRFPTALIEPPDGQLMYFVDQAAVGRSD